MEINCSWATTGRYERGSVRNGKSELSNDTKKVKTIVRGMLNFMMMGK
jgi:hypothetical protein